MISVKETKPANESHIFCQGTNTITLSKPIRRRIRSFHGFVSFVASESPKRYVYMKNDKYYNNLSVYCIVKICV